MNRVFHLRNRVQSYAWGSPTAIPELLGEAPSGAPQAELWMGAHPKAPSEIEIDGDWQPLDVVIRRRPECVLGAEVEGAYGPRLPFLLKVLAADQPLSIQAHPDRRQAAEGFARENAAGVALTDPARNYRDVNHKPEILCALTRFTALRGFRPEDEIRRRLDAAGLEVLVPAQDGGPRSLLAAFLALSGRRLDAARERLFSRLDRLDAHSAAWIRRLEEHYPGDRGVLAPVFLRVVELEPGQALFTGPGVLHAYLGGVGVELMASSDNVLRCGLTAKHVDPDELLSIASFDGGEGLVRPREDDGVRVFETPADDFRLSTIELSAAEPHERGRAGVQILLCTRGSGELHSAGGEIHAFAGGDAFLVPAACDGYRLAGEATVFRAEVARCPEPPPVNSPPPIARNRKVGNLNGGPDRSTEARDRRQLKAPRR